ncbi:hypothetical protein HDU85_000862 [Gaertneriomyces sp. JEL0708]|nr:hypothetical protein HDU85_000862 [Gaertneriomyces sp. JEL0708]
MDSARIVPKAEGRNPYTRVCYICGREFGSKSIDIHEKQCIAKFDAANAKLPKEQRRTRPKRPVVGDTGNDAVAVGGSGGTLSASAYNDAAFATFMNEGREECPNCGRKFLRDRLEVHLRSCKPGGYFAKERNKKADGLEEAMAPPVRAVQKLNAGKVQVSPLKAAKAHSDTTKTIGVIRQKPSTSIVVANVPDVAPVPTAASLADAVPTTAGIGVLARFCSQCGHHFAGQAKFCPMCGVQRGQV